MRLAKNRLILFLGTLFLLLPLACNMPGVGRPAAIGPSPTPLVEGPTPTPQPTITPRPSSNTATQSCSYGANLVASSLPHGARVNPGQKVTQTWQLENTGNCRWEAVTLQYAGGSGLGSPSNAPQVPLTDPGESAQVTVSLTAPQQAGVHRGDWQLMNADSRAFGPQTLVAVVEIPRRRASSGGSGTSTGTGSGPSSGGTSSGGSGGGSGGSSGLGGTGFNIPPWLSNVLNNMVLPELNNAGMIPSPEELALGALDPELVDALDLANLPSLGEGGELPENIYIEPIPRDLIPSSSGSTSKGGTGSTPNAPNESFELTINGVLKVSEYNAHKSRNLREYIVNNKVLEFDEDNQAASFSIEECASGSNKLGIKSTVYFYSEVKENESGQPYLEGFAGHLVTPANCSTGERRYPVFSKAELVTHRAIWTLEPGESQHVAPPWLSTGGLAGSARMDFDLSFEAVQ